MKTLKNQKVFITPDDFTRVNNDINGNPRYVCHFLKLIKDSDESELENDFAATLKQRPFAIVGLKYDLALERSRKFRGRKYHTKSFGGGIVFQSYNLSDLCNSINELLNK